MSGYRVIGNWVDLTEQMNTFPTATDVTIEACSMVHLDGFGREHLLAQGAFRVKAPNKRTRVFKGETAWMDAERLAGDWQGEINRSRNSW